MAGIWDRIAAPGPGADRCPVHLIKAAMYMAVRGTFTPQQLVDGINNVLTAPLRQEDLDDLTAILAQASVGTAIQKVDYLERLDALNIAAESHALTSEATWRSELGIT